MAFQFDHWEIDNVALSRSPKKNTRKVKYANSCSVVLIPSRQEYDEAGISLWYNRSDQDIAQWQVADEINQLMNENPALTLDLAMKYLYQPHVEDISILKNQKQSMRKPLNILVLDKDINNYQRTATALEEELESFKQWKVTSKHFSSGEEFLKHLSGGLLPFIDVVIIDDSIQQCSDKSRFLSIIGLIRSVCGNSTLVGFCAANAPTKNPSKLQRVQTSFDFMWTKPIRNSVSMLPLLLLARERDTCDDMVKIKRIAFK